MKHYRYLLFFTILFNSCIGEDFIDDAVEPTIRITSSVKNIEVDEFHQFEAIYLNNVGEVEDLDISWSSSDVTIVAIDENGLATGLKEGEVAIKASLNQDNITVEDRESLVVRGIGKEQPVEEENDDNEKTGAIVTTSSYSLVGDFTLSQIENTNDLLLSIDSNYIASSSLPGLYVYLSNNPNSVGGDAYEIGKVTVFNGAHSYTIPDIGLKRYSHVLYWCKPFGVKIGEGEIN